MFDFLNPLFLWAVVVAGIPLLLHLMQKRRVVRVPFSTLHFLRLAHKRASRRIRLEHFLLWLLRTLVVLTIAAAFAMPMLRTRGLGGVFATAQRDVAIVIDASYSMGYRMGSNTAWTRAVDAAAALVSNLREGDRVCLFLAADAARPAIGKLTADRQLVTTQLATLAPANTPARLETTIRAAYRALEEQSGRRERELHVFTDGQAAAWTGMLRDKTAAPWLLDPVDDRTACFITLVGPEAPVNTTPVSVETQPRLVTADTSAKLTAHLAYSGQKRGTTVTLTVDGNEVARRAVDAAGGADTAVTFAVPPLPPGPHAVTVTTPADNLTVDDTFHLVLHVKEQLPCLCVGTEEDTFYLMKALNAGPGASSAIRASRIDRNRLDVQNLSSDACVFLSNVFPLSGQAVLRVERYVKEGGLLVVLPGARGKAIDYTSLPFLPHASMETLLPGMRKRTLRFAPLRHPVIDSLKTGLGTLPVLTINHVVLWSDPAGTTQTLITGGAGTPFLLEKRHGRGSAVCLAVSANRGASSFPLSPFYLPVMHQLVRYGAGIVNDSASVPVCGQLDLTEVVAEHEKLQGLVSPSGEPRRLRRTEQDGIASVYAEDLFEPGIYRATGAGNTVGAPALAVNVDRAESDLAPLDRTRIPLPAGEELTAVVGSKEELLRTVSSFRVGQTFGEQGLWLALALAVAEVALANRLAGQNGRSKGALRVDAAGRVRRQREHGTA